MFVFIFPKLFEFFKFLSYFLEHHIVLDLRQIDDYEYHLVIFREPLHECYRFRILLINDSDINFYGIFSKLAQNAPDTNYLLIGSCGSGVLADLGRLFIVSEAVKGDRGKLDASQRFQWEKNKRAARNHHLWESELHALGVAQVTQKTTCSTNFLNATIIDKEFADSLFDMETYDFCYKREVRMYSCVRFVTDYVSPLDNELSAKEYGEKVQSRVPFELPELELANLKKIYSAEADSRLQVRVRIALGWESLCTCWGQLAGSGEILLLLPKPI